jgi:hypothetical protein
MRGKVLLALGFLVAAAGGAGAQGYPGGPYPGDPYAPRPRPPRGAVGYNCEAVQVGITGAAPFSCPLPGARRLGARCFCGQPVSAFSGVRPPLPGEVVP